MTHDDSVTVNVLGNDPHQRIRVAGQLPSPPHAPPRGTSNEERTETTMDGTRKLNSPSLDSDVPEQRSARAERRICNRPALRSRVPSYANVEKQSAALDNTKR